MHFHQRNPFSTWCYLIKTLPMDPLVHLQGRRCSESTPPRFKATFRRRRAAPDCITQFDDVSPSLLQKENWDGNRADNIWQVTLLLSLPATPTPFNSSLSICHKTNRPYVDSSRGVRQLFTFSHRKHSSFLCLMERFHRLMIFKILPHLKCKLFLQLLKRKLQ